MSENIDTKNLIKEITAAIQEKKGKEIVVADLTKLGNTICDYFVICTGNSPTQVSAVTDSVEELVRKATGRKPIAIDGLRNAQWVAMDYGEVLVHIFLPETREFYDIEHLWADANLEYIPNID
ncbi:MAG: ribosome silencing factor [Bacteroidaceae bacterium]|nr:ribosome silencing factor [Bacteroidaceae bacterium]MBQ8734710.1 ribosome silencing factor [Bacteroidaceae bacterium]